MRILYCSENYSPHDHRFLTALSRTAHEIFWLRLERSGRIQEERTLPENIQKVDWRGKGNQTFWLNYPSLAQKFKHAVEKIQPHLMHAGPIQRVALLPALIGFHPLLSMSWGFDLLEDANRNALWRLITRFVLHRSDWLTVDCHTVKNKAISLGFSEEKISIFPWGVNLKVFHPQKRSMQRKQAGYGRDVLIVHTRSWEPRYGVDVALNGFLLALQKMPIFRMYMLGSGSMEKPVRQFVKEKGLEERILLCGYRENESLAEVYRAADVYLSASHIDGSSVALMEAMACGCPAVVSDIPSNLEWVSEGQEGWVFKDGDAGRLAEQLVVIAKNPQDLIKRGENARRKAEKQADWDQNFAILMDTYEIVTNLKIGYHTN